MMTYNSSRRPVEASKWQIIGTLFFLWSHLTIFKFIFCRCFISHNEFWLPCLWHNNSTAFCRQRKSRYQRHYFNVLNNVEQFFCLTFWFYPIFVRYKLIDHLWFGDLKTRKRLLILNNFLRGLKILMYRISANSFRGNCSFLILLKLENLI